MTKKEKQALIKIIICMLILLLAVVFPNTGIIKTSIYISAYLIVGYDVVLKAIKHIVSGKILDEHFLMSVATVGAFFIGEYLEAVLVMLLYQIGELFQSYAVGKSRKSIAELMDIRPDYANIEKNGLLVKVAAEEISIDDKIIVKPGEKIPLDGTIEEGESTLDTTALTGESIPREVKTGDTVLSGCINKTGILTIKVTKKWEDSTATQIIDLVENASNKKAKAEKFITKFAKYYTPIVVILALALAFIPPIWIQELTITECAKRAMTFLVISCPCALVISVPLGFFGGIGGASRQGILIKGSNYLEALANTKTIVFDKTGTLTEGKFQVIQVVSKKQKKMLELATLIEVYSHHPIALAIREKYGNKINKKRVKDIKELAGLGMSAAIDNKNVYAGNEKLMQKKKINYQKAKELGTIIYIAEEKEFLGYIVIADKIKENAKKTVVALKEKNHIKELIMLTGDKKAIAEDISQKLKLDKFYAELLPKDKVDKLEIILKKQKEKEKVAFVGDGINDAPVLTRADIGIAMGSLGSDAAIEAADVVIMNDDIAKISTAINLSQRTIRIVKQNIYFAIGIKIFFLLLGAFGVANMMEAVFADVGVSILAILNSMRTLRKNKKI